MLLQAEMLLFVIRFEGGQSCIANAGKPNQIFSVHLSETHKFHSSCTELSIIKFLRSHEEMQDHQ